MRALRFLAYAAVLLFAAALFLPAVTGRGPQYVKTYGNSMEPSIHAGDLAVLRPAADYQVGDVAAYLSPRLNRVVLHRVIERRGDTFIFKGDNNSFTDPEILRRSDLLGRLTVLVPRGGAALTWLQNPAHAAATAFVLAALPAFFPQRKPREKALPLSYFLGKPALAAHASAASSVPRSPVAT